MVYKSFFELAKKKKINKIQVTEKHTIDSSAEIINGKLESYDDYDNIKYDIKAEFNHKNIKLSCNYLDEKILDLIIFKSNSTDTKYEDEYIEKRKVIKKNNPIDFDISTNINQLKEMDNLRIDYKVDKLSTYISETYTNTRIINNKGLDISTDSHLCKFTAEAIIEKDGEYTSYDKSILTTDMNEINFETIIKDTIEKVILQSNKKKIKTSRYNIILDSNVSSRIISHLSSMLSSENIRKNISCLNDKKNEKIFSSILNIIEDPTNKNMPGYRLFDDEGTDTIKKELISNGVIKCILYNIKEAKIQKTSSTGNGYQGIETRNMYVIPGKKNEQELIKELKDGIYITDYMGASGTSINTTTGQISLQIFGFIVKNGKIDSGIMPSIMTTSIFELLSNIKEISSDMHFTMLNCASPSLLIEDISIAR